MLTSVVQASALGILTTLIEHYSLDNVFQPFDDYKTAYKANRTELAGIEANGTNVTSTANITSSASNATWSNPFPSDEPAKNFLVSDFPKAVVHILIMTVLRYYWIIWLERLLPARPRPSPPPSTTSDLRLEKRDDNDDDSREEEVIRKWIQSGRVQRASLSWANTLLKWLLDLTVGNLASCILYRIFESAMELKSPWAEFNKWEFLFLFSTGFFGVAPLATLIGFILIPAQQRIVFEGGVDLAWKIFFAAFVKAVVPWVAEREYVREILRNISESEFDVPGGSGTVKLGNVGDEL